jgi:outer membrane lipoprotein carrier protein
MLCLSLVLCGPALATAEDGTKAIPGRATLESFLNVTTNYSARFKQTLYDEYGELLEESEGQLVLAKPGKFRWEYQQPYRQLIVSDGILLWVYDEDLEQVTINKVPEDSSQSPLALLVNGVDIESRYRIEAVPRDDKLSWLGLTPRTDNAEYQRVEIAVNDVDVVAMRLHDNLNQLTELTFLDANRQPTIDQRTFEFVIPPGVDVVNGAVE